VPVMLMRTGDEYGFRPARRSWTARVYDTLWVWFQTAENYLELRRQRRNLLALDDRMLKDIGISRADISRIGAAANRPHKRGRRPV
jgi:uncharacterized protein YjiS (DUF1127 family)